MSHYLPVTPTVPVKVDIFSHLADAADGQTANPSLDLEKASHMVSWTDIRWVTQLHIP